MPTLFDSLRPPAPRPVREPPSALARMAAWLRKAVLSSASTNDLPDSAFAIIEPGGVKDASGKTLPRSLRHLPYRHADGSVDPAHLRNALARVNQTAVSAELRARGKAKLDAAARRAGIGDH